MAEASGWPFDSATYAPFLDNGLELQRTLKHFESTLLSDETAVSFVENPTTARGPFPFQDFQDFLLTAGIDMREGCLNSKDLHEYLKHLNPFSAHKYLFINRFLVLDRNAALPKDSNKLRISSEAFRSLVSQLEVPLSFVSAITQLYLPAGRGFSGSIRSTDVAYSEFWYILPVRIQFKCNDKKQSHAASTAGSNQMNPLHYIHLPDAEVDIRGSQIAILSRYSADGKSTITLTFNFIDGRWRKSVEEPKRRLLEMSSHSSKLDLDEDPFHIHAIYFTSTLRWWMNALSSVNEQLIAYEKRLQEEIDNESQASNTYSIVSRALHSIAAHLHRYGSELSFTQDTIDDVNKRHKDYQDTFPRQDTTRSQTKFHYFDQIGSHVKQVRTSLQELEVKLQNILALLFNRIQIANDGMMVSNGERMHSILVATQEDAVISSDIARQSKDLAEEMKRDSVAMKTIAVTTMVFLPGTSFAAFLAMPFFATNRYLSSAAKVWIWAVCTVISTVIAFTFYFYWKRREDQAKRISLDADGNEWHGMNG